MKLEPSLIGATLGIGLGLTVVKDKWGVIIKFNNGGEVPTSMFICGIIGFVVGSYFDK